MTRVAGYIAFSVASAICGFLLGVGLMSVLFNEKTGTFAPSSSQDAAGWVQAVGSIAAIVMAYLVGAKQAKDARQSALEVYQLDRTRVERGCQALVIKLVGEVYGISRAATKFSVRDFVEAWRFYSEPAMRGVLDAFDNMPIHELGGGNSIQVAFEIRSHTAFAYKFTEDTISKWDAIFKHLELAEKGLAIAPPADEQIAILDEGYEAFRTSAQKFIDRGEELLAEFNAAYKA